MKVREALTWFKSAQLWSRAVHMGLSHNQQYLAH